MAKSLRDSIFDDIEVEREYQNEKWGNAFDDANTVNDWVAYITRYASNASFANSIEDQKIALLKVASLAVAAIEACERNNKFPPRHYDKI